MPHQVTNITYDKDTGILSLRLIDGSFYVITNPGHARILKGKISVGGELNDDQLEWLHRYKTSDPKTNKQRLLNLLKSWRNELQIKGKR